MNTIDSLNRNGSLFNNDGLPKKKLNDAYKEDSRVTSNRSVEDKLEISLEAIKLQPIKQKIAEGFYENQEVLDKVSERLLKEISEK
jgi:hypothetical protein